MHYYHSHSSFCNCDVMHTLTQICRLVFEKEWGVSAYLNSFCLALDVRLLVQQHIQLDNKLVLCISCFSLCLQAKTGGFCFTNNRVSVCTLWKDKSHDTKCWWCNQNTEVYGIIVFQLNSNLYGDVFKNNGYLLYGLHQFAILEPLQLWTLFKHNFKGD